MTNGGRPEHIKEGDLVSVHFHGAGMTLCKIATVLHVPKATGDSWIFRDEDGDPPKAIHHVSEGCTVTKRP